MNPSADVVSQIPDNGDPIIIFFKWLAVIAIVILVSAAPVMSYIRKFKSDSAANAKDDAAATLYQQLQEQIRQNADDIRSLVSEKNRWFQEATELRVTVANQERRIAELVEGEVTIRKLRAKLDEKDGIISLRDAENRQLTMEVMQLKDRIHSLEIRLTQDEEKFCAGCRHKHGKGKGGERVEFA